MQSEQVNYHIPHLMDRYLRPDCVTLGTEGKSVRLGSVDVEQRENQDIQRNSYILEN